MKIRELNQHCGECDIIEFCGNSFCYCVCNQERFKDVDTDTYKRYAEQAKTIDHASCQGCKEDDCENCELGDEVRDFYCKQVAAYVANEEGYCIFGW